MTAYILIIIFSSGAGHNGFSARFDSKKACMEAKDTLSAAYGMGGIWHSYCLAAK